LREKRRIEEKKEDPFGESEEKARIYWKE